MMGGIHLVDFIEKLNKLEVLLMSGISSVLITHLFYKFKLRSEQKIRFQNIIGDEITKSLIELRDLVAEASVIERYDIIHAADDDDINAFEGTIYPAIMNDSEMFKEFHEKTTILWTKNGNNLDCVTALHLWYASRYFTQLLDYIKKNEYNDKLPLLGVVLIADIQKWHTSFEKCLIKRINKPKNKLELHQGKKWKIHKIKFTKMWESSILYKCINGFNENEKEIADLVFELLDQ